MSVDAIGFGIGAVGITIRSTLNFQSVVHINGQQESLDEIFTVDSESSLRKVSSTSYELVTSTTTVSISVLASTIIADISVTRPECCQYSVLGLCGPCSSSCSGGTPPSSQPGVVIIHPNCSREEIEDGIEGGLLTDPVDVIFFPNDPGFRAPSGGYALYFRGAAAFVNRITLSVTRYTTVAFYIKTCDQGCGGTVISYSHQYTFYVSTTPGFYCIHYHDFIFKTDIVVIGEVWQQVCLVFDRTTLLLDLYVIDTDGTLIRRSCTLPADIFPGDGNLGFGVWVPPLLGSGVIPDEPFTGAIDDIRVWDR